MLSVSSSALARLAAVRSSAACRPTTSATTRRGLGMRVREEIEELPSNFSMDAIQPPPHGFGKPYDPDPEPMAYVRKPVTSAHAIDLLSKSSKEGGSGGGGGAASALDSAAFGPNGSVVHGRYGVLDAKSAKTIPLEYLALLRPASEGAAALREITAAAAAAPGTILVYGASRPSGMSAVQLANASGHAVVAVVDGQHSGHDEMVDTIKGIISEPGTAVAEEYAVCKANFRELVHKTAMGDDYTSDKLDTHQYLSDFKANLLEYIEYYPSDLPAAVDSESMKFMGKEKDRANFKENMTAYLSQFQPGADPIDPAQLDRNFTVDQYERFKAKFGIQTTAVISGGDDLGTNIHHFAPAQIVRDMCYSPEEVGSSADDSKPKAGDYPFEFSIRNVPSSLAPVLKGGPVLGAVIVVTPDLQKACEAVASAKTLRAKAEALQFLTESEKNAHAAASSIVAIAKKAGATIRTVGGSLPGLTEIQKPADVDVTTALQGMAIDDDGNSKLNYFIQVYRAGDWPVYQDYAIHRAKEPLSGPREIVVTK